MSDSLLEFFNWRSMHKYFSEYNYLEAKYSTLCKDCGDIRPLIMRKFCDYETNKSHIIYNKIDYKKFKEKFNMIYNDNTVSRNMVFYFDFAIGELIDRFLNIDTLNKLFNDHYIEFEWLQHVELNFEKMDLKFYRDHFIHQIRNCYMIMRLLDGFEEGTQPVTLMDKIKEVLKSRGTEISKYAYSYVQKYKEHIYRTVETVLLDEEKNGVLSDYFEVVKKNPSSECIIKSKDELKAHLYSNAEDFAWEYLIRGSFIISSLFHDIGYPVQYVKNCLNALNDFIPSIIPQDNFSFDRLNDLLGSSLLFTIVEKSELEEYYKNSNHGAMSAYVLLLHFYETGTIHSLSPIKRAMVEFAALMIFDHTFDYYKDNKTKIKPSFAKNPLSYTLRFVDDLQEWDRVYFEIKQNSDLRYCEKCQMPIGRIWDKSIEKDLYEKYNENFDLPYDKFVDSIFPDSQMKRQYICGCHNGDPHIYNKHHFSSDNYENGSLFPYCKINYSIICDNVVVISSKDDNRSKDSPLVLDFYIDYDPFRELYLLSINNKALDYRMNELKKLSKQFDWQHDVKFSMTAYMTNNPIMLKLRVLIHFLYELGMFIRRKDSKNIIYNNLGDNAKKYQSNINNFIKLCEDINLLKYNDLQFDESADASNLDTVLNGCIEFFMNTREDTQFVKNLKATLNRYLSLVRYAIDHKLENESLSLEEYIEKGMELIELDKELVTNDDRIIWANEFLFKDVFRQMYYLDRDKNLTEYWKEACDDKKPYKDLLCDAVATFMDNKYYKPTVFQNNDINMDKFAFVDFKSDLYLFKEMYRFSRNNSELRMKALFVNK